jgi:DNA-binding NarL/FixJ family response regulator
MSAERTDRAVRRAIRILLLDDHSAVRAGIGAIVAAEPDVELAGAAGSEQELWQLLRTTRPDVVLLDLHHPGRDGLSISFQINRRRDPPAVVLYSSHTDDATVVGAALAGAGAVVSKSSSTASLLEAIWTVASTPQLLPEISLRMRREAAARLDPADRPILAMRLAGYPPGEIGETLRLPVRAVRDRLEAIIAGLEPIHA